jgi:hypothetical protein
VEEEL